MTRTVISQVLVLALFAGGLLAGCATGEPLSDGGGGAVGDSAGLAGTAWMLTSFGDADAVPDSIDVTAAFSNEGRVTGTTGCNQYSSPYDAVGDSLTVGPVVTTKRHCDSLRTDVEERFLTALRSVHRYRRTADSLVLQDTTGTARLRFVERPGPSSDSSASPVDSTTDDGDVRRDGGTYVFKCPVPAADSFAVMMRVGTETLEVWLPERFGSREHVLPQTIAASGARYEGAGLTVWLKGAEALVEIDEESYRECVRTPTESTRKAARRRGLRARGHGQEPGWMLEVRDERIQFVGDYGRREVVVPRPEPAEKSNRRTVYRAKTEDHLLEVDLEEHPCTDTMSGDFFTHTVTVALDGTTYRGCGHSFF